MVDPDPLDGAEIERWTVSSMPGAHGLRSWRPLVSGNSRELWAAEAVDDSGGTLPIVVRVDQGRGPLSGTAFDLEREASVYRALVGRGIRLPRLLAEGESRMVLERLPGEDRWTENSLPELLDELARLHAVPAPELELPRLGHTARADLEQWTDIAAGLGDPLLEVAARILHEHFPGEPQRLVLCHGDAGPGNVLFRDDRLTALLDWEFAHCGDPMDDLAWVTVRACLYGIELHDFAAAVRRYYTATGGATIDGDRFRYWQTVVLWRNLICCLAAIAQPDGAENLLHLAIAPALRALLVDALAKLVEVPLPQPASMPMTLRPPVGSDEPGAREIHEVAARLRRLEGELENDRQRLHVARMRILIGQLAQGWGRLPARAELDPADHELVGLAAEASRALAVFPRAARTAARPPADLE